MKTPDYFNLLVAPGKLRIRGASWLRTVIVVVFIALIALFLTAPVHQRSAYDQPLPMPAGVESSAPASAGDATSQSLNGSAPALAAVA